jgi:hypothetical protein
VSSDRRWSGGIANRTWNRAAGAENIGSLSPEEEHELYLSKLDSSFYCPDCGTAHPLRENCDGTQREIEDE